jgi:hypothetical protein
MEPAARPLPHWVTVSTDPAPAVLDGRACQTRAAFWRRRRGFCSSPVTSAATGTRSPTPCAMPPIP